MTDPVDHHARDWQVLWIEIAEELEADIARERADAAMRHARWARFGRVMFCVAGIGLVVGFVMLIGGW